MKSIRKLTVDEFCSLSAYVKANIAMYEHYAGNLFFKLPRAFLKYTLEMREILTNQLKPKDKIEYLSMFLR